MKKKRAPYKVLISLLIVASIFTSAFAASAASGANTATLKTQTKSTPYGVLTGRIEVTLNDFQVGQCSDLEFDAYTTINSSTTMSEVSTEISCVYNDTGEKPGDSWSNLRRSFNTKSCVAGVHIYPTAEHIWDKIAVFTAHQVIGTNAYVLNMSTVYDPNNWG